MDIAVRFTRDGHSTPEVFTNPPDHANDIHFFFTRGKKSPTMRYTQDKKPVGEEYPAPEGATDVGVEFGFKDGKLVMYDAHWTDKDGVAIGKVKGYVHPPDGADDWHLDVKDGIIDEAYWSRGGDLYKDYPIHVPENVNDAHVGSTEALAAGLRATPPWKEGKLTEMEIALPHGGKVVIGIDSTPGHTLVYHHVENAALARGDTTVTCTCWDANNVATSTTKTCPQGGSPLCDCTDPHNPKITC